VVANFTLYGLDEAGRTSASELLRDVERGALRQIAEQRLERFSRVEIWEGPVCILRLARTKA
jgi:hypothetical protein